MLWYRDCAYGRVDSFRQSGEGDSDCWNDQTISQNVTEVVKQYRTAYHDMM